MNVSFYSFQNLYFSIGPSLPRHLGGHPTKLTTHDWHHLARKVTFGAANTAPQLKKLLDLNVRRAGGVLPESIAFRRSRSQGTEDGWMDGSEGIRV